MCEYVTPVSHDAHIAVVVLHSVVVLVIVRSAGLGTELLAMITYGASLYTVSGR